MSLFPKLEIAVDHGLVLLVETTALVRLAHGLLKALEPTVAELPDTLREARRVLETLERFPRQ
ncbi:MAG: hypothetical protein JNL79_29965 [Myxococcales bacterium]|nr:hypothetical protein [Myxococcales bacterium]